MVLKGELDDLPEQAFYLVMLQSEQGRGRIYIQTLFRQITFLLILVPGHPIPPN